MNREDKQFRKGNNGNLYFFTCIKTLCVVLVAVGCFFITGSMPVQNSWYDKVEESIFDSKVQIDHIDFFLTVNGIDDYDVATAFFIPRNNYLKYETEITEFYSDVMIRGAGNESCTMPVVNNMRVVLLNDYHLTQAELEDFYTYVFMRSRVKSQSFDASKYFAKDVVTQQWTDTIDLGYYAYDGVTPVYHVYCKSNIGCVYPLSPALTEEAYNNKELLNYELSTFSYNDIYWDYIEVLNGDSGYPVVDLSWLVAVSPTDSVRGESEKFERAFDYLFVPDGDETISSEEDTEKVSEEVSEKTSKEASEKTSEKTSEVVPVQNPQEIPQSDSAGLKISVWVYIVVAVVVVLGIVGVIGWCLMDKKKKKNVKVVVFCPACGELLKETDKVCTKCGHELKEKNK